MLSKGFKTFNILMVCTGNMCRSPTAAYILQKMLAKDYPDLNSRVQIRSAGLRVPPRQAAAHPTTQQLLDEKNIDCSKHVATQINKQMVQDADLVLVMEEKQRYNLFQLAQQSRGKVFLLGEWSDFEVDDPVRGNMEDHRNAQEKIEQGLKDWVLKL